MRALTLGDRHGNVSTGKVRPFKEIDIQALLLITDRAAMKPMAKRMAKQKLAKQYRRGMAFPEEAPEEWQWRMTEARMMLGDFADWDGWQWRNQWAKSLWMNPEGAWKGQQPPECEKIWIYGEQGIGDELLFCQVLPDCARYFKGEVVLECEPRMVPIIKRSMPEITPVAVKLSKSANGHNIRVLNNDHGHKWMPLGDLVRNFRRYPVQFKRQPWIKPDPAMVEKYAAYKGRIGIVWRGAQGQYPWRDIEALYPGAVSLQYDQAPDECVERCPFDQKEDVEDLLGLIANLDRVVGPSNTAIHMAASQGVRTDVILAPMMSGRRKNPLPFRYYGIPGSRHSMWYGDNLIRYESLDDYRRNRDQGTDSPFGLY